MKKTFTDYMKEQEEIEMNNEVDEQKAKVTALFTIGEPVTDEILAAHAEETETDVEEIKAMVYQILTDLLMAKAEEEVGGEEAPEEIEDIDLEAKEEEEEVVEEKKEDEEVDESKKVEK